MIEIRNLSLRLGAFALHDVSLHVNRGEYVVVLGPTGSGKTVLLECVAGLLRPDTGEIRIDGKDVTSWPPEQRGVGLLPQDFALFPHLTVGQNLAFGLIMQGRRNEVAAKTSVLSEMLGIGHLLDRHPGTLSGGEQQRAALGRALAVDPQVMLLDEPLSALDVATREQIGAEIRRVHDQTGVTSIHICHNFDETLRLADRVVLVHDGRVVQAGTAHEVLRQPRNLFAAQFVQAGNILRGTGAIDGAGRPVVRIGDSEIGLSSAVDGDVHLVIRPDEIELGSPEESTGDANSFVAAITATEDRGDTIAVRTASGLGLTALVGRSRWRRLKYRVGDSVRLSFPAESVHVLE